jgi:3-isopropylmalate dehydrogenase
VENTAFDIAVLPGDGIGIEVIEATVPLIEKAARGCGFTLRFTTHAAGALHYKATGDALPGETIEACRNADAILFGAMGWPDIRYPDGTEIAPQLDLRFQLDLYAGVRPARAIPAYRCRWLRRGPATSISSSCAKTLKGCSPRAAKA